MIGLMTLVENQPARRLYENAGFSDYPIYMVNKLEWITGKAMLILGEVWFSLLHERLRPLQSFLTRVIHTQASHAKFCYST